jgi:hypothetical protein
MTRDRKHAVLSLIIGLLTLAWVGSAMGGMPGMFGQWPGFHASEKGFPGWSEYDQDTGSVDTLSVTQELEQEQGYGSYQGFEGAQQGQYPGGRPNGK